MYVRVIPSLTLRQFGCNDRNLYSVGVQMIAK
jgi:hypothetical protein